MGETKKNPCWAHQGSSSTHHERETIILIGVQGNERLILGESGDKQPSLLRFVARVFIQNYFYESIINVFNNHHEMCS